jgi:predicted Zn-dependent protease
MKRISLIPLVLFIAISGIYAQSDNDSQNTSSNSVKETAREAWGLYVQYKRTIDAIENYWEDEIATGLSNNIYINSMRNVQYNRVKIIFDRLLQSQYLKRDKNKYNWRIYIQNSDAINAFAALNGIIIINKGIIDFCQNDDELALIIGHEMAHMTENHIKKQLTARVVKDPIIERISAFIAKKKNKRENIEEISDKEISDKEFFQLIFGLAGELALLKYSRVQEEKADEIGAKYAASVGYDTDKGYDFWNRMALISNNNKWLAFLSTHPYSEQRAKAYLSEDYKRKYYKEYH